MTIEEISEKSGIDLATLQMVLENYKNIKVVFAYENVPSHLFDAYAYLWRNLAPRFSDELREYQL